MANFIAVDFGTTNCAAGRLIRKDGKYKLELIPLDDESELCPSVVFTRHTNLPPISIDEVAFESRVRQEMDLDLEHLKLARDELERKVDAFIRLNAPRIKEPDRGDYLNDRQYEVARRKYQIELEQVKVALEDFLNVRVANYRRSLTDGLRKRTSEELIRRSIRNKMMREASESRSALLWESSFFGAFLSDEMETLYGTEAAREYAADPLSGFFLRSPKAFLAADLKGGHRDIFVRALSRIFRMIRSKAEAFTGEQYDGVVLGRPVNFRGSLDNDANRRAVSILIDAARNAGFPEVRFVLEPLAAAAGTPRDLIKTDDPIVVIDIGGGTTDIAYLKVDTSKDVTFEVIGYTGERFGGNDFDDDIAWKLAAPFFGKGAVLKDGKSLPTGIISSALNTRDIQEQSAFRKSGDAIERYVTLVQEEFSEAVFRLYDLFSNQFQNRVLLECEQLKIDSSAIESQRDFNFFENPFSLNLSDELAEHIFHDSTAKIVGLLRNLFEQVGSPDRPVKALITGGMSQNPILFKAIQASLPPRSTLSPLPPLKSVIGGLSVITHYLNESLGYGAFEADLVRGIPITRS